MTSQDTAAKMWTERAMKDARDWMTKSFPNSPIFENRVQGLALLLLRHHRYGINDTREELLK